MALADLARSAAATLTTLAADLDELAKDLDSLEADSAANPPVVVSVDPTTPVAPVDPSPVSDLTPTPEPTLADPSAVSAEAMRETGADNSTA